MKRRLLRTGAAGALLAAVMSVAAQPHESDWDTYLMQVEGRPVSVVVDLGLRTAAPMADRPLAVLIRTRILRPQPNGLPGANEAARLDSLEQRLEDCLQRDRDAVYAGRYTHRGIRTFHFFTADSTGQATALHQALAPFPEYAWLAQTLTDTAWSNYFDVLYPPPREYERIRNRRLVDHLQRMGDPLTEARRIEHFLRFPTKSARMEFLRQPGMDMFTVTDMPEADTGMTTLPYRLHLSRKDVPDHGLVDRLIMPLHDRAERLRGRYEGWETHLVK
jgi:hypothetical protein